MRRTVSRTLSVISALAVAIVAMAVLGGCSSLGSSSSPDDESVKLTSSGGLMGFSGVTIDVEDGEGIALDPNIESGGFQVLVTFADKGPVLFEGRTNNMSIKVEEGVGTYNVFALSYPMTTGSLTVSVYGKAKTVDYYTIDEWKSVGSGDEAASAAGLNTTFEVPESFELSCGTFTDPQFSYSDRVAQVEYSDGDAKLSIRKLLSDIGRDFSGEYSKFPSVWDFREHGLTANCHGSVAHDAIGWASWDNNDCHYSVMFVDDDGSEKMNEHDLRKVIQGTK